MLRLIVLLLSCTSSLAFIGFNCGGTNFNMTTISLLNAAPCDLQTRAVNTSSTYIQLLQSADFHHVEIMQCKVSIARTIHYCGMHSHISLVHNGYAEFLQELTYHQCRSMHLSGVFHLGNNNVVNGLRVNSTTSRPITLAGSAGNDGRCEGTQYSDPYGHWSNMVVQGVVKITLRSGIAPLLIKTGRITLQSGTTCQVADTNCLDLEDGYTFWDPMPFSATCDFANYDVLYEGLAKKTQVSNAPNSPEVYSLITNDVTFALARTSEMHVCGYKVYRTEHPKLFILETSPGNTLIKKQSLAVENLNLFTYVNSKFVFVEKHIRTQMTDLYNDVITQKCELERQVLMNALSIATSNPEEFAYTVMRGPGYTAVPTGEVIRVIKCIAVEVNLRHTTECFEELPVTHNNHSYFLTPKSHILKKVGTVRECNSVLAPVFRTENGWLRFLPNALDAPTPEELKPKTKTNWEYFSPGKLASSGIYTQGDIDKLQDHMMFPVERTSLTNNIIRGFTGKTIASSGISLSNMLDEEALKRIAESTTDKIWNGIVRFGTISASAIGIWFIWITFKTVVSTIIHGYTLHSAYGCGFHIFGAIWSATTHLLLYLAKKNNTTPAERDPEAPPATKIEIPEEEVQLGFQHPYFLKANIPPSDKPATIYPKMHLAEQKP